jgi:CHASE1-domain containing sensor protein
MKSQALPLIGLLSVLAVGGSAAVWMPWHLARTQAAQRAERFDHLAERILGQLKNRIQTYEYGLRGARGMVLVLGAEHLSREKFKAYSESRELAREFPGARGYGFIRRVPRETEAKFLRQARLDGKPEFQIRELAPHGDERLIIQYIEPEAHNRQALGLDIASETNRRDAAWASIRSGASILTHPIALVQANRKEQSGFLFLLPVYRIGAALATAAQREQAAFGLVYTPLAIDEVLADFDFRGGEFSLGIADVDDGGRATRFFDSDASEASRSASLAKRIRVPLYGRIWEVELRALPLFVANFNQASPRALGLEIFAASLLLAAVVYGLLHERERKRQILLDKAPR